MKKRWIVAGIICLFLVGGLTAYFIAKPPTFIYYANQDNYICVTGTVDYINYTGGSIYFGCTDLSPNMADDCFKLTGANVLVAKNNDILHKLKYGAKVEMMVPALYYGNGYVYPVAAIIIDGEELLSFEEGFDNMKNGD